MAVAVVLKNLWTSDDVDLVVACILRLIGGWSAAASLYNHLCSNVRLLTLLLPQPGERHAVKDSAMELFYGVAAGCDVAGGGVCDR